MKVFVPWLAALAIASDSPPLMVEAPPAGGAAEAILAAVAMEVTRSASADMTHCLALEPYGAPRILRYLHDRSFTSGAGWLERSSGKVRDITGAEAREIDAAARVLIGLRAPGLSGAIPPEAVRSPWRIQRKGEGCGYKTSLSSPLLNGDWAFVEASSVCGGHCGDGWLYVLRRDGSSWRVVATTALWIS